MTKQRSVSRIHLPLSREVMVEIRITQAYEGVDDDSSND